MTTMNAFEVYFNPADWARISSDVRTMLAGHEDAPGLDLPSSQGGYEIRGLDQEPSKPHLKAMTRGSFSGASQSTHMAGFFRTEVLGLGGLGMMLGEHTSFRGSESGELSVDWAVLAAYLDTRIVLHERWVSRTRLVFFTEAGQAIEGVIDEDVNTSLSDEDLEMLIGDFLGKGPAALPATEVQAAEQGFQQFRTLPSTAPRHIPYSEPPGQLEGVEQWQQGLVRREDWLTHRSSMSTWLQDLQQMLRRRPSLLGPRGIDATDITVAPEDTFSPEQPTVATATSPSGTRYDICAWRNNDPENSRDMWFILRDGEPVAPWVTPIEKRLVTSMPSVQPALERVLQLTAKQPEQQTQHSYEGDTIDAMLERAERGIVAFHDAERDLSDFATAAHLQHWLRAELPSGPAEPYVVAVDIDSMQVDNPKGLLERHRGERVGSEPIKLNRRYFASWAQPWAGDEQWYSPISKGLTPQTVWVGTDGSVIDRYEADFCLLATDVTSSYQTEDEVQIGEGVWFGIGLKGVPSMLVLPPSTLLEVSTDHDGASISLTARHRDARRPVLEAELDYQGRWYTWLNDDSTISQDDLDSAEHATENALEAKLHTERQDTKEDA